MAALGPEYPLVILVLALDAWALRQILQGRRSLIAKVIWTIVVLALPLLGFALWTLLGPRTSKQVPKAPS